jgi:hypothetical protein
MEIVKGRKSGGTETGMGPINFGFSDFGFWIPTESLPIASGNEQSAEARTAAPIRFPSSTLNFKRGTLNLRFRDQP